MSEMDLFSAPESVGFDAIKNIRPDGSEYWSARELMPLMGYDKWQNFASAIERGKLATQNSGQSLSTNFTDISKVAGQSHNPQLDVELSRFAAYLVALNGDPRKPETASAQTYFVIRTREAETAPVTPMALPSKKELAQWVIEAEQRAEIAQAKVAELEPKALVAEKLLDAEGDLSVRDAAQALTRAGVKVGQNRLFAELERRKWVARAKGDGRYRPIQSAIESGFMSVLPQSHYHPRSGVLVLDPPQPRITPKGLQRLLAAYDHSGNP